MDVVVRRYIDILTIINSFFYFTCINSFFGSSIPTSLFIFKTFFPSLIIIYKKKKNAKWLFFTSRGAHVNCTIMALLYTHSIGKPSQKTMVVFKMRDSVPRARYYFICKILCQWKTALTPIRSVDSRNRDERGFSLTQYIKNGEISRARYAITHFKHNHHLLRRISNRMSV